MTSPPSKVMSSSRLLSASTSSSVSDSKRRMCASSSAWRVSVIAQKNTSIFRQSLRVRFQQIAPRDDADHAARVLARHDRQPADVLAHHVIGGVAQRRVEEDDGRSAVHEIAEARVARLAEEVAAGDDARKMAARADDRKALMRGQ